MGIEPLRPFAPDPPHARTERERRREEERRKQRQIEKAHKRLLAEIFKEELEAKLLEKRRRRIGGN